MRNTAIFVAVLNALISAGVAVGRRSGSGPNKAARIRLAGGLGREEDHVPDSCPQGRSCQAFEQRPSRHGPGVEMKKAENGVWEATVGPVPSGCLSLQFQCRRPGGDRSQESRHQRGQHQHLEPGLRAGLGDFGHRRMCRMARSLQVTYYSNTLKRFRRMHVYTPPGYEKGEGKYPVFYLLHGAFDCDASWTTVGRAGFILDNLIAAGKAKPMIVAMPAGHTGPFRFGPPGDRSFDRQIDEFGDDFVKDLKPYVEKNYRVLGDRAHRAIAGLSMGGAQTLNIAFGHLDEYGYVGVFSSGIFGITGGFGGAARARNGKMSTRRRWTTPSLKKELRLVWFGIGKDDFLIRTSNATVDMLKNHKFDVVSKETAGGHTWINWRDYLHEFAPMLFSESRQLQLASFRAFHRWRIAQFRLNDQAFASIVARRVLDPGGVGRVAADRPGAPARRGGIVGTGRGRRRESARSRSSSTSRRRPSRRGPGACWRGWRSRGTRKVGRSGSTGTTPRGTPRRRIRSPARSSGVTTSWSSPCRRPASRRWPRPTATRSARTSSGW